MAVWISLLMPRQSVAALIVTFILLQMCIFAGFLSNTVCHRVLLRRALRSSREAAAGSEKPGALFTCSYVGSPLNHLPPPLPHLAHPSAAAQASIPQWASWLRFLSLFYYAWSALVASEMDGLRLVFELTGFVKVNDLSGSDFMANFNLVPERRAGSGGGAGGPRSPAHALAAGGWWWWWMPACRRTCVGHSGLCV